MASFEDHSGRIKKRGALQPELLQKRFRAGYWSQTHVFLDDQERSAGQNIRKLFRHLRSLNVGPNREGTPVSSVLWK